MILNKINEFILIEYDQDQRQISNSRLGSMINGHTNEVVLYNDDDTDNDNQLADASVILPNGKYAVLDKDTAYYYPNVDPEIQVSPQLLGDGARYSRIRIHILSGYNFVESNNFGFNIEAYLKTNDDKRYLLMSHFHGVDDISKLKYNPNPIRISQNIYDKYIELYIVSPTWINGIDGSIYESILNGQSLASGNGVVYFDYKSLSQIDISDGFTKIAYDNNVVYSVEINDRFDMLSPVITESSRGDYFEYCAKWGDDTVEDLIYKLNGTLGQSYSIIHELELWENVGLAKTMIDSFTSVQTSSFDDVNRYRPIIMSPYAHSFTINYTIKLYNNTRGDSIVKMGSITNTNTRKYGEYVEQINVGSSNSIKIYNKIQRGSNLPILDDIIPEGKINVVYRFVESHDYIINDQTSDQEIVVQLDPFDNFLVFNVKQNNQQSVEQADLTIVGDSYEFVFTNSAGELVRVVDSPNHQYKRSNGKLVFNINASISTVAVNSQYDTFYVIAKSSVGDQNVMITGRIDKKSRSRRSEVLQIIPNNLLTAEQTNNNNASS